MAQLVGTVQQERVLVEVVAWWDLVGERGRSVQLLHSPLSRRKWVLSGSTKGRRKGWRKGMDRESFVLCWHSHWSL